MYRARPLFTILFALLMIAAGLSGCGVDDPAAPAPDPGPDWPENDILLPAADVAALDAAADRWEILRLGKDLSDARAALVAELNDAWPDIDGAGITSDGSTVAVRFSDGATAFLCTYEDLAVQDDPPPATIAAAGAAAALRFRPDAIAAVKSGCADMVPPETKVHIVNTMMATNLDSRYAAGAMRQFFESAGWDPEDIETTVRLDMDDTSFTPESLTDQYGYGVVIFIGGGGMVADAQGEEHFFMQCFSGGEAELYEEHVGTRTWEKYLQWYQDGEMISGEVWNSNEEAMVEETWIRGDRLAEEMLMYDGTLVGFVCPHSSEIQDAMLEAGAGGVMAWDGSFFLQDAVDSINGMAVHLEGEGDADFAALLAETQDGGLGYSEDLFGAQTSMTFATGGGDYYLPASVEFEFPAVCQPPGFEYYDVLIRYPDCPERDETLMLWPGSDWDSATGLFPAGAEIYIEARDEYGELLDTGYWNLDLDSGPNAVELCPCDATLDIDFTDYPQDGPYAVDSVEFWVFYPGPEIPSTEATIAMPVQELPDMTAAPDVSIVATAYNAAGEEVGSQGIEADLPCGRSPGVFCFGWLTFTAGNYPADTAEIVVTIPDNESAVPASVTFAPGGEASMYGFSVGWGETYEAEAFNSLGVSLGTMSNTTPIECGANEVSLDFNIYGIIMDSDPRIAAGYGWENVTVTATLREWAEGDLLAPTGDPRVGVYVEFDTDEGSFIGDSAGVTDDAGEVSVELYYDDVGIVRVRAFSESDGVESRPLPINFGLPMSFQVSATSEPYPYDDIDEWDAYISFSCHERFFYLNGEECFSWLLSGSNSGWFGPFPYRCTAVAGDTLKLRVEPLPEESCYSPPRFGSAERPELWLHTWYGDDYDHQSVVQLRAGPYVELTEPIEFEAVLEEIPYYDGGKSRWR